MCGKQHLYLWFAWALSVSILTGVLTLLLRPFPVLAASPSATHLRWLHRPPLFNMVSPTMFASVPAMAASPSVSPTHLTGVPFPVPPITPTTRQLGTITNTPTPTPCGTGVNCYTLTVTCTQLARNLNVTLRVGDPISSTAVGTILFFSGWIGTSYWPAGHAQRSAALQTLRNSGYRTVEVSWASSWWFAPLNHRDGMGNLTCLPATVIQWANTHLYNPANEAFCATGHSLGGTQLAYPMAQYGLGDLFTAVLLESGPNWSRIDAACLLDPLYPNLYDSTIWQEVDNAYGFNNQPGFCTNHNMAEQGRFQSDSLAYDNWTFVYPQTAVAFLFGSSDTSSTRLQGALYYDRLLQAGTPWVISATLAAAPHYVTSTPEGANYLTHFFQTECQPATIYVASDPAACAGQSPCETGAGALLRAVNRLPVANGTVVIQDTAVLTHSLSITRSRPVTIRGALPTATIVSSVGACSGPFLTIANGTAAVTLQDVTLDGDANCTAGRRDGLTITGGVVRLQNVTLQDLGTAVSETGSTTLYIGDGPTTGNTFSNDNTAVSSDGQIIIKGNTITGGGIGFALTGNATAVYGNNISGVSGLAVDCSGAATLGAAFNYLGGVSPLSGSDCSDRVGQLGSPILSWTEGTSLNEINGTAGPLFDLGMSVPYGYAAPVSQSTHFYAATAGNVAVTGGTTQFKMLMSANGCQPMTGSCWQSAAGGRPQTGPGYFYGGGLDPTAVVAHSFTVSAGGKAVGGVAFWLLAALSGLFYADSGDDTERYKDKL